MAEFFFSVPGAIAIVGLGILVLARNAGPRRPAARARVAAGPAQPVMPTIVSVVMLGAGAWVILSGHYGAGAVHWAAGTIGTVVGYWLKP